jgi:hypothetical protein
MSDVSIYCPYCHRYTSLTVAPTIVDYAGRHLEANVVYTDPRNDSEWWIGICNSCKEAVLVHSRNGYSPRISPDPLPSPTDERIPDPMKSDLVEAKMCFAAHAFRGCAMMARRAVQSTCIDKGANKNNQLVTQLEELRSKGVITQELASWGHSVRWIGNDAAHPDSSKVEEKDADDILKLAEEFLRVIYVTPQIAKEQAGKRGPARQDGRKNEKK